MAETYDPKKILEAVKTARELIAQAEQALTEATGHDGCFANDTPEPVMRYINEADEGFAQARRGLSSVSYAVKRWKMISQTGEKF